MSKQNNARHEKSLLQRIFKSNQRSTTQTDKMTDDAHHVPHKAVVDTNNAAPQLQHFTNKKKKRRNPTSINANSQLFDQSMSPLKTTQSAVLELGDVSPYPTENIQSTASQHFDSHSVNHTTSLPENPCPSRDSISTQEHHFSKENTSQRHLQICYRCQCAGHIARFCHFKRDSNQIRKTHKRSFQTTS